MATGEALTRYHMRKMDASPSIPNNLPGDGITFIGREADIEPITALLTTARCVTLVGSGGIGKTRLLHI